MNLVFFGPPGAGKGTQAVRVCESLGIAHISTGDMFRAAIAAGTKVGLEAKSYIDQGHLVPDRVTIDLVRERIAQPDCANGFALDGFPRTLEQARELQKFAKIDAVVDLEAPDKFIVDRLAGRRVCEACGATTHVELVENDLICPECGGALIRRKDDNPDTIQSRLEVYHAQTKPLAEYFTEMGLVHRVDATIPKAKLTPVILAELAKL